MAKDPIFPVYYNDLIGSTKTWTDEEFGAYVRLLIEQWDKGFIPTELSRLNRIAETSEKNWKILKEKFILKDGKFLNENMEKIREKRNKFKEKQIDNVTKRYTKLVPETYQSSTKNLPLENEIEKEKENRTETELEKKLAEFYNFRKQLKKPIIDASKEAFIKKLNKYSNNNEQAAIEILDNSIANGWQGIFKLEENGKQSNSKTGNRQERVNGLQHLSNLSEGVLDNHSSKNS